jgi:hypothetical protein
MKQRVNHYSDELKLEAVQEYLYTGIGLEELKKRHCSNKCVKLEKQNFLIWQNEKRRFLQF